MQSLSGACNLNGPPFSSCTSVSFRTLCTLGSQALDCRSKIAELDFDALTFFQVIDPNSVQRVWAEENFVSALSQYKAGGKLLQESCDRTSRCALHMFRRCRMKAEALCLRLKCLVASLSIVTQPLDAYGLQFFKSMP